MRHNRATSGGRESRDLAVAGPSLTYSKHKNRMHNECYNVLQWLDSILLTIPDDCHED